MSPKGTRFPDSVLDLDGLAGLREEESRTRLQREGPNELPAQKERNLFTLVLEVVREPMFLMLVARASCTSSWGSRPTP